MYTCVRWCKLQIKKRSFVYNSTRYDITKPFHIGITVNCKSMWCYFSFCIDSHCAYLIISNPDAWMKFERRKVGKKSHRCADFFLLWDWILKASQWLHLPVGQHTIEWRFVFLTAVLDRLLIVQDHEMLWAHHDWHDEIQHQVIWDTLWEIKKFLIKIIFQQNYLIEGWQIIIPIVDTVSIKNPIYRWWCSLSA